MKSVRIIVVLGILLSGTFVTFYGGVVAYELFYLSLAVPLFCFLYTLYVYMRFKIYQLIDSKTLVKEEKTEYFVQVGNEDFITYENIKLNYYDNYSIIENADSLRECSLPPGKRQEHRTSLLCRYRGEYPIGVKSVQITDFLHLFHITYPIQEPYQVTVLPKLLELSKCFFLSENLDDKVGETQQVQKQLERGIELREFRQGDEVKMIHWKASARFGELMTRKWNDKEKPEVLLLMELVPTKQENAIIREDKMLEATLAIALYCINNHTVCHLIYEQGTLKQKELRNLTTFHEFYESTSKLYFQGKIPMEKMLENVPIRQNQMVVLLVFAVTQELLERVGVLAMESRQVVVLVFGERPENWNAQQLDVIFLFLYNDADVKCSLEEGEVL